MKYKIKIFLKLVKLNLILILNINTILLKSLSTRSSKALHQKLIVLICSLWPLRCFDPLTVVLLLLRCYCFQGVRWTPSKVIHRLGKEINNPESIFYWAYKVCCPGAHWASDLGQAADIIGTT